MKINLKPRHEKLLSQIQEQLGGVSAAAALAFVLDKAGISISEQIEAIQVQSGSKQTPVGADFQPQQSHPALEVVRHGAGQSNADPTPAEISSAFDRLLES